ncbi:sll1863 family stress response protein [Geomesophilobacter sediminis]|uniref:Uncharacterized protein n=1 Tax=Geomesophilobacter sediminis TaxID=2798584 RepID=A0A8J7LXV0_9BACT|nr:hypothetical protein [Geomesophilobacter sediminis]MBJ6723736.1 hypothetical protein [Geomesophilobacter sediminis]
MENVADYVAHLSAQLYEWDQRLARLRERAELVPAQARLNFFSDIELLELRRKVAGQLIREIDAAGGEAAEDERRALERIWADLRGSLQNLDVKIG